MIVFAALNFELAEDHFSPGIDQRSIVGSVTLSADCREFLKTEKAQKYIEDGVIPSDGIILEESQYSLHEGDSAFTVLKSALNENNVLFDYTNVSEHSVYVKGISNVYEYDGGDLSGWMYSVNGVFPTAACSEYILENGDEVRWMYTCDLGRDIGDTYYDTAPNVGDSQ